MRRAQRLLASLAAVALCPGVLCALERSEITPGQPNPPAPQPGQSAMLVDDVLPAYGISSTRPYRSFSRVERVLTEIRAYCAQVEANVMAGTLSRPVITVKPVNPQDPNSKVVVTKREPLPEELQLATYYAQLKAMREGIMHVTDLEALHFDRGFVTKLRRGLRALGRRNSTGTRR